MSTQQDHDRLHPGRRCKDCPEEIEARKEMAKLETRLKRFETVQYILWLIFIVFVLAFIGVWVTK